MAGDFYRQRVSQHLEIGLKALEELKTQEWERLHSRKLRSFAEIAFQESSELARRAAYRCSRPLALDC
jgi:hypothetical protein